MSRETVALRVPKASVFYFLDTARSAYNIKYREMLGQMRSLLGNGKLNTSMDTLGSPTVPHGCIATKNRRPQQHEGQCFLLGQPDAIKATQYTTVVPVSSS
jgi:hypothetical protein